VFEVPVALEGVLGCETPLGARRCLWFDPWTDEGADELLVGPGAQRAADGLTVTDQTGRVPVDMTLVQVLAAPERVAERCHPETGHREREVRPEVGDEVLVEGWLTDRYGDVRVAHQGPAAVVVSAVGPAVPAAEAQAARRVASGVSPLAVLAGLLALGAAVLGALL
jgi:hypothetical protein